MHLFYAFTYSNSSTTLSSIQKDEYQYNNSFYQVYVYKFPSICYYFTIVFKMLSQVFSKSQEFFSSILIKRITFFRIKVIQICIQQKVFELLLKKKALLLMYVYFYFYSQVLIYCKPICNCSLPRIQIIKAIDGLKLKRLNCISNLFMIFNQIQGDTPGVPTGTYPCEHL